MGIYICVCIYWVFFLLWWWFPDPDDSHLPQQGMHHAMFASVFVSACLSVCLPARHNHQPTQPALTSLATMCSFRLCVSCVWILNDRYGKAADWWALGTLVFEMLVGAPPFYQENRNLMYKAIMQDPVRFPEHVSDVSVMAVVWCVGGWVGGLRFGLGKDFRRVVRVTFVTWLFLRFDCIMYIRFDWAKISVRFLGLRLGVTWLFSLRFVLLRTGCKRFYFQASDQRTHHTLGLWRNGFAWHHVTPISSGHRLVRRKQMFGLSWNLFMTICLAKICSFFVQ